MNTDRSPVVAFETLSEIMQLFAAVKVNFMGFEMSVCLSWPLFLRRVCLAQRNRILEFISLSHSSCPFAISATGHSVGTGQDGEQIKKKCANKKGRTEQAKTNSRKRRGAVI